MTLEAQSLDIAALQAGYRAGRFTPVELMREIIARQQRASGRHVWISRLPDQQLLAAAEQLSGRDPASLPLYGVPFAIKDNIDFELLRTTAACEAFAYQPTRSAPAVERLIAAGAIPVGKTNLDQFATGLVGTRSPYGVCVNSFDGEYISGGSSSGSAVAVAMGIVSFALGTDTAGSGRVPAAFNNIVGLKPTLGRISPRGVVPACRTLDTVSLFTLCAADARLLGRLAAGFDAAEAYSRPAPGVTTGRQRSLADWRWAVPQSDQLQFFGCESYRRAYQSALTRLRQSGRQIQEVDFAPFLEVARLLYEGPWVAERQCVVQALLEREPAALLPVIRDVIGNARRYTATDGFRAQYRLAELRRQCEAIWQDVDALLTPTAGAIFRISDVQSEPLLRNSELGYYTNFVNLLDMAAVAVPAGMADNGLPFGLTMIGRAWSDEQLLLAADDWQRLLNSTVGAMGQPLPGGVPPEIAAAAAATVDVAVCGAHMQGLPLNQQLTERGATLKATTVTAPQYRFYALPGGPPLRPGLMRVAHAGAAIEVEVWSMPVELFGSFVAGIPAPLGIGKLELADGSLVCGFLCEACAVMAAEDITACGGWRGYLRAATARPGQS